jgi:hypothetical protein
MEAAAAFNLVSAVLAASQNPTEIMEKLQEK